MRTTETDIVFSRDRTAVDSMVARGHSQEVADRCRASMHQRHAEYDDAFQLAINWTKSIDPRGQPYARQLLERLGGRGCRSGTMEFCAAVEALASMGLQRANGIFEHDRQYIASTLAIKTGFTTP